MYTSLIIIFTIILFFLFFAIWKELTEYNDSFLLGKPKDNDSLSRSIRKVIHCIDYDKKTIKWRRTLISTLLCIFLIFGLIHRRIPTAKEFILYLFFIFMVFYLMWKNYVSRTASEAISYSQENLKNIKTQIFQKHNFILPW